MKKPDLKTKLSAILMIGSALSCCTAIDARDAEKGEQAEVVESIENCSKMLQDLAQREIDTSFLFAQAIENVNSLTIKETLTEAKQDREKNIEALAELLHQYGREAPAHTKDFKGYFMQGYLAMRGLTSDQGLMRALHSNLKMLIGAYDDALKKALPKNVRAKVIQIHKLANKHLEYVASRM